jgi:hypothetical protein
MFQLLWLISEEAMLNDGLLGSMLVKQEGNQQKEPQTTRNQTDLTETDPATSTMIFHQSATPKC